jgi:predicted phosphodiesterase
VQRIALISDVHGNAILVREVLRSIGRQGADEIVCLGDVATLGVAPAEVVDVLGRIGCRCIRGNHGDYVLDPTLVDSHCESAMVADAIDWCRGQLSREQVERIRRFESAIDLPLESGERLMLFHGSPGSNTVHLLPDTPEEELDAELGPVRAAVMAGGHKHIQMLREHRGTRVLNPGSVGAPFREPPRGKRPTILDHAEYASLEVRAGKLDIALHRVALDRHELARAALESRNPMRAALAAPYL